MSSESKGSPATQVDIVAFCAAINFEGVHHLYPGSVPKPMRERLGHAVVMGTVRALFATDPEQRLTRDQLLQVKPSVADRAKQVLFEHCWHALEIPEPEAAFIEGVDQWKQIEKTRAFLEEALSDEQVWPEFAHYFRAAVNTDWDEIITRGTPDEKEWCIRVHVKFLSPVEEAQVLGALHLAAARVAEKNPKLTTTYNAVIHGKAPEPLRRQLAEAFAEDLGLKARYDQDEKKWTDAVDYFDRAFSISAFWEGDRAEAIASNFPADPR